ncbi:hypothetical protein HPP92_007406 [Vanilla planifolia]|uniref:Uncharacterized protein n=1 Tax=Vanilla planifolia TaxID=51239 RepID=A0A835RHH7_VANPL|nr:hypothetical protein HPP92_007556 [Vanilla planifolia]KAG0490543.1 hypothetical protein HPP92_007406 [Vanilla planifolia]
MATQSYPPPAPAPPSGPSNPVVVVGERFCAPYTVDLTVTEKAMSISDGDYAVTDVNGNIVFKVKGKVFSLHDRRSLLDLDGNPIVSMQQKLMSMHRRWQSFWEMAPAENSYLARRSRGLLQFRTELDVFLASNTSETQCDFKVKGSFHEKVLLNLSRRL